MEKHTIYIASLEETLDGKYYKIEGLKDYIKAREDFLKICANKGYSDDLEIQYIDGNMSGDATDYIEDVLRLSEEYKEDIEVICALFKIANIEELETILENQNYYKYPMFIKKHFQSKEDAFREYLEDTDYLVEVPEHLKDFIDYKKLLYDFECRGLKIVDTETEHIIIY